MKTLRNNKGFIEPITFVGLALLWGAFWLFVQNGTINGERISPPDSETPHRMEIPLHIVNDCYTKQCKP